MHGATLFRVESSCMSKTASLGFFLLSTTEAWGIQIMPLTSFPMMAISPPIFKSLSRGRRSTIRTCKVKLGFFIVGFTLTYGPSLKPLHITRSSGPNFKNIRPRFVLSYSLLSPIRLSFRFPHLCGRRHRQRWRSTSMHCSCYYHLRTMALILLMVTLCESTILKIHVR